MSAVVALLMTAALALLIAYPLFTGARAEAGPIDDERRDHLERERKAALLAIRESELDHAMGKLSANDYASLRALYERRALAAISALDHLEPAGRRRPGSPPDSFCPHCGRRFAAGDRFCAGCGNARGGLATGAA